MWANNLQPERASRGRPVGSRLSDRRPGYQCAVKIRKRPMCLCGRPRSESFSTRGAIIAAGAALLLGACGTSEAHVPEFRTTTTSNAPRTVTTAAGASTTSTTSPTTTTQHPSAVGCATSQLVTSEGSSSVALSHVGHVILFKNQSSESCDMSGYPGVAFLDTAGHQAAQATRNSSGYMGGLAGSTTPPLLHVTPGETVSALVEGSDQPQGGAGSCPAYPAVLVTPPGQYQSVRVAGEWGGCYLAVHPVVAGTTGSQG